MKLAQIQKHRLLPQNGKNGRDMTFGKQLSDGLIAFVQLLAVTSALGFILQDIAGILEVDRSHGLQLIAAKNIHI